MAVSPRNETCQNLQFAYGVHPVCEPEYPHDWNAFSRDLLQSHSVKGDLVILTEGPSSKNPGTNHRMELIDLTLPAGE